MLVPRHWSKPVVFCFAALITCSALAQTKLQKDIEYARAGDVSLRFYASVPDGPGPFPAVIIVHGGGYTDGNKKIYVTPILELLSRAGFAWFSIDYRLAPQYKFPAAIDDVDRDIEYVKSHFRSAS